MLDGAHARGFAVILGTPTYAVPPWLARLYPEIAGQRSTGQRIGWGGRQEVDFTHPAFRFHAERVVRSTAARYARHPAVIGFQVDNESGSALLYNHGVFQRFVDHLRAVYTDVEILNREWGLTYWSHRLSTWADLWTPEGNVQPQYDVAWRAFQARQTTEFIAWQADIVREYARSDQFVTTCIAYGWPAVEDDELTDRLDITAGNPYYGMQDALALPGEQLDRAGLAQGGPPARSGRDRTGSGAADGPGQPLHQRSDSEVKPVGVTPVNRPLSNIPDGCVPGASDRRAPPAIETFTSCQDRYPGNPVVPSVLAERGFAALPDTADYSCCQLGPSRREHRATPVRYRGDLPGGLR